MTNYCKSNVRRVINYTNTEPLNKYDLWLSENLRYNEDGELEYDNNGQPACDLILKIFRNGKWEPIVGYNTASENKINIVKGVSYTYTPINYPHTTHTNYGFSQNHLPLFRNPNDSPDELFDAGTLGEAICGFVTESEWNNIFQTDWFTNAFNTSIIGGNDYNWSNLIQELISGGDVEIPLANTRRKGGIKAAQDPQEADDCRNIPIVLAGPNVGSVWGLPFGNGLYPQNKYPGDLDEETEYLYLPGWALLEWMKNPYFNQQNPQPFISGWKGVDVQLRQNSDLVWVGLSGVIPENTGKFCTVQLDITDPSGATIEWVDLPEGTIYSAGTGITISQQNAISINTTGALTDQVLTKTASGVGWSTPSQQIQYTGTNLIKVNNSNNEIGINMDSNPSSGDIIICDNGVAKWGAIPNPNLATMTIQCGNGDLTLVNNLLTVVDGSFTINGESYSSDTYTLNYWTYYIISNYKALNITNIQQTANPIYMRFSPKGAFTCTGDVIDAENVLTDTTFHGDAFVTLQFGIAKFEKIQTVS